MDPLRLVLELPTAEAVATEWTTHLSAGGAYVKGATAERDARCLLVLRGPGGSELEVPGKVVYCGPEGVGIELADKLPVKAWVEQMQGPPEPEPAQPDEPDEPAADDDDDDDPERDPAARNVFERLRGMTVAAQLKLARDSDVPSERMALERMYGKTVWESLLKNSRVTHPEVARIARMGTLPRPMLELIVANTAWLRSPEIRRALLGNKRLAVEMIQRVLRLLPKPELRLVPNQTAYPSSVRDVARRMLKDAMP